MKDICNIDLLNKFQNLSDFTKQLSIKPEKLKKYRLTKDIYNFYHEDEKIISILKTVEKISTSSKKSIEIILNLLQEKNAMGTVYELSAYTWLLNNNALFTPQIETNEIKTLSNNNPVLDGCFKHAKVYFDIKTFDIPNNILDVIKGKIEDEFPSYHVMIGGNKDVSYQDATVNIIQKIDDIFDAIKACINEHGCHYTDKVTGIEFQLEQKTHIHLVVSSFDYFKWAKDNEMFFMKSVSQYTCDKPFLIICPFTKLPIQPKDDDETFYILRALARRAFINLRKGGDCYHKLIEHQKVSTKYTMEYIADTLSGILFIDIQDKSLSKRGYLFINPNGRNKLKKHTIERIFDFNSSYLLDDFHYDNY